MINTRTFGVNLEIAQVEALDREAKRRGVSRNGLIRLLAAEIMRKERDADRNP